MKLPIAASAILAIALSVSGSHAFQNAHFGALGRRAFSASRRVETSPLLSTPSAEDMRRIMEEESKNPKTLADSAAAMKNMSPDDMAKLISEMENMPEDQKAQLKEMGMDPDTMLVSMKMMKENPQMMATAQKLMSNMTPEQMLEQSRAAQEKMSSMSKEELEQAAEMAKAQMENLTPDMVDEAIQAMKETSTTPKPVPEGVVAGGSSDPNVIDAMYRVAEMMSKPATGGVTFQAFSTLPPITVLSGEREQDLSRAELSECWLEGSLGSTRVDRTGFVRVWNEVQEYFEEDIMEEARVTSHPKVKKSRSSAVEVVGSGSPLVGGNIPEDQMKMVNEQVKNMTDDDMQKMLENMSDIGPAEEERMRAMGADPAMMKKAAEMMKTNPMMRKAAQMMMKNMSPDQMLKASQDAQSQMASMSKEELEKAMDRLNQSGK